MLPQSSTDCKKTEPKVSHYQELPQNYEQSNRIISRTKGVLYIKTTARSQGTDSWYNTELQAEVDESGFVSLN